MGYMVAFPKPTDQNNAPLPALMHLLLSIYSETVKVNKQHCQEEMRTLSGIQHLRVPWYMKLIHAGDLKKRIQDLEPLRRQHQGLRA